MSGGNFSLLAEEIARAFRNGDFIGAIVKGKLRVGKTVYTLKVMRDVYMILDPHPSKRDAYNMAQASLYFHINSFMKAILEKQRQIKDMLPKIDWTKRFPVVTLDDASIYAGPGLYFKSQELYDAFQGTMTTIGTAVAAVLVTAPTEVALTKCLREYYEYLIVSIRREGQGRRLAVGKEWYKLRSGGMRLRKVFEDEFTAHVPNSVYAPYLDDRITLGIESPSAFIQKTAPKEEVKEENTPAPTRKKSPRKREKGQVPREESVNDADFRDMQRVLRY